MKIKTGIMFVFILLLFVFGCSNKTTDTKNKKDKIKIYIGYGNNPGEPLDLAVRKWKELLEKKSNGTIIMRIYPSSQLGSKNDLIDQMLAGDSVITLADGAFYSDRGVKDLGILFGPYLFDSWDQCWKITESQWFKKQTDKLKTKGLKILTANWIYGDRHTITVKPVYKVSDLAGRKIRVPNNIIQIEGFKALGATPTPMALSDVYTSLQQGIIDGLENPLTVIYNDKFHEVAKYLILDGHVKNFTTWVCGTKFFDKLTPEQQNILQETGNEAGIYNNKIQDKLEKETLKKLKAEGVKVIDINKTEFKDKAESFYSNKKLTSDWTPKLYEKIQKSINN